MRPLASLRQSVGLIFLLMIGLAIAGSLALRVAAIQTSEESLQDIVEEAGGDLAFEAHAHYGNIFLGEVTAVVGQEQEKWGPEDQPNDILYYSVSIKETLRGEAAGEVEIMYLGSDSQTIESLGFGPLKVGQRYLFSAGLKTDEGAYPVNAGTGTILVEDDQAEAALLAEFTQLIPQAEAEEREALKQVTAEAREEQRKE